MVRETRVNSYDYDEPNLGSSGYDEPNLDSYDYQEPDLGPVDLDESRFISPRPTQAMMARQSFAAQDPMPMFLSGRPQPPRVPEPDNNWNKAATSSRILKTGILIATAAAIVFGIFSVENPLAVFANAKASLPASSADQPSAPPAAPVRIVSTVPVPVAAPAAAATTAMAAPTREEIAAALRTAHQGQPEIRQPEARQPEARQPPATATPVRQLDPEEVAVLLKRAKGLIAIGDIAPARLLLERAADARDASAALLLAETYDPAVLGSRDERSIAPNPAIAREWYQKAAQFGSPVAQQRLAQMQN